MMNPQSSRWIFQTMVLSIALNVALVGIFFYFLIRDNPLHFSYTPKEKHVSKAPPLAPEFLAKLPAVSMERLVQLLQDERKLEQGFQLRAVALGALASYHDFDVERGLGRGKLSKQVWEHEGNTFIIYPGLSSADYTALQVFARQDRWPLTTKGLFQQIKQAGLEKSDPELLNFFCHTNEFVLFETLFARTRLPIQKRSVLNLALESGWERFSAFATAQEAAADFSDEVRQGVLLGAIENGSQTAAYLLLLTDRTFARTQVDDAHLIQILDLLTVKTQEALQFAQALAASQRIAPVKERAIGRICDYTGSSPDQVAGHFIDKGELKQLRPVFRETPPAAPAPGNHIVQDGESLWVIARKYKVSTDALMQANGLQSPVIRVGKTLKIPRSS